MKACTIPGCTRVDYSGRGLCVLHYQRARNGDYLEQFPRLRDDTHPLTVATMPDIPETCEPIVPNPPHYRPWGIFRDVDNIQRDGGLPSWSSWLPMRTRMLELNARDDARHAADYAADPEALAEYERQVARWRGKRAEAAA